MEPVQASDNTAPPSVKLLTRLAVGFSAEIWDCEIRVAKPPPWRMAIRITHRNREHLQCRTEVARLRYVVGLAHIPGMPKIHAISEMFGKLTVISPLAKGDGSQLIRTNELSGGTHRLHG